MLNSRYKTLGELEKHQGLAICKSVTMGLEFETQIPTPRIEFFVFGMPRWRHILVCVHGPMAAWEMTKRANLLSAGYILVATYEIGLRRSGVTMIHVSIRRPNDNNNIVINSTGKKTMFVNRNV